MLIFAAINYWCTWFEKADLGLVTSSYYVRPGEPQQQLERGVKRANYQMQCCLATCSTC
jgi:hypothetical protein